ncbi:5509_t:CDS:2, partial [Gigaspora rosea]
LRKLWHGWMANGGNGLTKGENLKRADLSTVCYWVLDAWNDIPEDIIVRAFKKCGISNCLSGSEDHLIYDDNESDSDKSDEYNEDEEFDEDYEPVEGEFDEGNEDDDSNEYNKYPECFVVIEV